MLLVRVGIKEETRFMQRLCAIGGRVQGAGRSTFQWQTQYPTCRCQLNGSALCNGREAGLPPARIGARCGSGLCRMHKCSGAPWLAVRIGFMAGTAIDSWSGFGGEGCRCAQAMQQKRLGGDDRVNSGDRSVFMCFGNRVAAEVAGFRWSLWTAIDRRLGPE